MTRTRQSNAPAALIKDRHLPRSGLMDPRGNPKKEGAGNHNWGTVTDQLELEMPQYDRAKIGNTKVELNRDFQKLKVVNSEQFKALQNAVQLV